jgi:SAM-dependent methyltransferase
MRKEGLSRLQNINPKKRTKDFIVLHYLVQDLHDAIIQYGGRRVFDIGCGNKPYESIFTQKNIIYKGCDVVQSNLNKVDILCEATAIPEPDGAYDTVLCTQVLEHVDDPEKVMREAHRILEPNGYFILSIPFAWELHEEPYDFFRFSKYGIDAMISRNGFKAVTIKANGGKWAAIMQLNLNAIYSSFQYPGFFRKVLKGMFLHLGLTALCNNLALWADRKWHDPCLTLNYVVVAQKTV